MPDSDGPSFFPSSETVAGWSVTYPISLPAGYPSPTGITNDPVTGGLWLFAHGPEQTLFHWSAVAEQLTRYTVPSRPGLWAGLFTPILVDHDGRAWLGINQTLVIVHPGDRSLRTISLPPVAVAAPESGLPRDPIPDPRVHSSIEALTLGPNRSIIVGRAHAAELQVVNSDTENIGTIPLPPHTVLAGGAGSAALTSTRDGTIVAGALSGGNGVHPLGQYIQNAWTVTTKPCPTYGVTVGAGQLVISGYDYIATGPIPSSTDATAPVTLSLARAVGVRHTAAAVAVSPSTVLACVPEGVTPLENGKQLPAIPLGRVRQGPPTGPGLGRAVTTADDIDKLVPVRADLICSVPTEKAWVVPAQGPAPVGLMVHADHDRRSARQLPRPG